MDQNLLKVVDDIIEASMDVEVNESSVSYYFYNRDHMLQALNAYMPRRLRV